MLEELNLRICRLLVFGEKPKAWLKAIRPEKHLVQIDIRQARPNERPVVVTILPGEDAARRHNRDVREILLGMLDDVTRVGDDGHVTLSAQRLDELQRRGAAAHEDHLAVAHPLGGTARDRLLGAGVLAHAL